MPALASLAFLLRSVYSSLKPIPKPPEGYAVGSQLARLAGGLGCLAAVARDRLFVAVLSRELLPGGVRSLALFAEMAAGAPYWWSDWLRDRGSIMRTNPVLAWLLRAGGSWLSRLLPVLLSLLERALPVGARFVVRFPRAALCVVVAGAFAFHVDWLGDLAMSILLVVLLLPALLG